MNIVLYGATGRTGTRILKELVSRGHTVKAVARNTSAITPSKQVSVAQDDLLLPDDARTVAVIKGADAVVSAYGPPADNPDALIPATAHLIKAVQQAGVPRIIFVGGAGGLNVAPGVSLIDSGHLPTEWLPIAKSHVAALNLLRASSIDWTYFAPAAFFEPGERTGKFRLGHDELISDANHNSRISMEDYSIALVDELEKPAHHRQRFSIGY